jgi:hypothetical protein
LFIENIRKLKRIDDDLHINYRLFGSECRVDHVDKDFHARYKQPPCRIVVTRIPENVNENELCSIFIGCQSLKYYPGHTAHFMEEESTKIPHHKILSGYTYKFLVEIEIILLELLFCCRGIYYGLTIYWS